MNLKLLICLLLICYFANAQPITTKPSSGILFSTQFSLGRPYGDLANRYGSQICVGGNLEYQPNWNFLNFGFGYSYFFGSKVKEDVLAPFRTPNYGLIIGADNALAEMKLGERGHILKIYLGGIIPIGSQLQARKGLSWELGSGYIWHKIRFQDDAKALRQFNSIYTKGLDRFTAGLILHSFVGYTYLQHNGRLCFKAGIEPSFGFTESQRSWNYDTNTSDVGIKNLDILLNYRLSWIIPFYFSSHSEELEY